VINPNAAVIGIGSVGDLQVTNQSGGIVADCNVKWTSADTRLATVDPSGLVTALKVGGPITIRATASTKPSLVGTAAVTISALKVGAVNVPSMAVVVGTSVTLSATVKGTDGSTLTNRILRWSSASPAVATVDSMTGKVTGVSHGSVSILATSEGVRGTGTITVGPVPVQSVTVNPESKSLYLGQTVQLAATALDNMGRTLTGRTVGWSSGTPAVATINDQGLVTAVAAGTTVLTATIEGKSGTATVTVAQVPVQTVIVNPGNTSLYVGQTVPLIASARDSAGGALTGRPVTWSSSTPSIATISPQGLATAVGTGTATLTAAVEGKTGTATVTVLPVPVQSIQVTPAAIVTNGLTTLQANVFGPDGSSLTNRTVRWLSADPSIATIDSITGLVRGIAAGLTTVTAISEGVRGHATLSVSDFNRIVISSDSLRLVYGETARLTAVAYDRNNVAIMGATTSWSKLGEGITLGASDGQVTTPSPNGNPQSGSITASIGGMSSSIIYRLGPNLRGLNLNSQNWRDGNLSWADFTGASAVGAVFLRTNLTGAKLDRVDFSKAILRGANLAFGTITSITLSSAVFDADTRWPSGFVLNGRGLIGPGIDMRGADLRGIEAGYGSARSLDLSGSDLTGAILIADFTGGRFVGANLTSAIFRSSLLYGANFDGAILSQTDFRDAYYDVHTKWPIGFDYAVKGMFGPGTNLSGAMLEWRELVNLQLRAANFSSAKMKGANLRGSDLTYADFRNADLSSGSLETVDLTGAQLAGTILTGTFYNALTKWPAGFDPVAAGAVVR
jgi:uncharacterized protein YjbI with pentapeptide repeats/uncharacterized protein YjdB